MSESAYPALTAAQKIFKDLIWDPGIRAGELYLETQIPILSAPVLKTLEEGIVNEVTDYIFHSIVTFIDVTAIRLVNAELQHAYDTASLKLKIVIIESGVQSAQYVEARNAAKVALSRFMHIGP